MTLAIVGDSNALGFAGGFGPLLQGEPLLLAQRRAALFAPRCGIVQQHEIYIRHAELFDTFIERRRRRARVEATRYFRGDPEILALEAGAGDRLGYIALVIIAEGAVESAVADR